MIAKVKHFYFVRHGETEGNTSLIKPGYDPLLNENGISQAEFLAKRCERLPIQVIIASPLERTRRTAGIIAQSIHKEIREEELVVEWWHPKSTIGVPKKDLPSLASLISDEGAEKNAFPDGESFSELKRRALLFMRKAEQYEEDEVLVATHFIFAQMFVACVFFGEALTHTEFEHIFEHTHLNNTGIVVFQVSPENEETHRWKLLTWNDRAHLG